MSLLLAVIHLVALALGVCVLVLRAKALAAAATELELKPVFLWDNLYAAVALFWLGSGLFRAFGGFEKGTDYYLGNHVFWTKMLLLLVVLGAEAVLMVTFIRFRVRVAKRVPVSLERKAALVRLHWVELWSIVGMVLCAVVMARGIGVVRSARANESPGRGAAVYRERCVSCHQLDGRGLGGQLAPDFVAEPYRLAKSDAELSESVRRGVPGTTMRAFGSELTDADITAVVAYVRATARLRSSQ